MSTLAMSDSGPLLRRRARVIAYICVPIALLLFSPVVVYDIAVYWRARGLISILKRIEVGKTTGRDAIRIAERFGGTAYISEHTVIGNSNTWSSHDVPLIACMAGDCELSLDAYPRLPGSRFLGNLCLDYPGFRRWVPASDMGGYMEIRRGVVQEVQTWMASLDVEVEHYGRTNVYGEESHAAPWNRTPWSIRKVQAHITGGPGRRTNEIRVEAWSSAPHDRILHAFDFNMRCLWLGFHCSRCQILPSACEWYDHGDWYEFEMPEEALAKFREAVNNLKLGAQGNVLYDQLGTTDGFDTGRRLRDLARDRLPFDFPDGTIFGSCPGCLTFYVKKWRLDWGSPEGPGDQSVTFVMDKDRRLQRIESRVEGILSRP